MGYVQIQNLLYLLYPGRLSSVSVVEEEKPYAEEDVDDRGDEWEVQQQAGEVFRQRVSLTFSTKQLRKDEAQLEGKGEEH